MISYLPSLFAQVNFGFNTSSLLGWLLFLFGVTHLIATVAIIIRRRSALSNLGVFLYVIQALMAIIALPLAGLILVFQGWRLDPVLQFSIFLLTIFIIYIGIKDLLIDFMERRG